MGKYFFTSESVTEGHPDKICDYIADLILDECVSQDKNSRVAVEVMVSKNSITVNGQITSKAEVDIENLVRETLKNIGYDNENLDIDYRTCKVEINIVKQSKDIENMIRFDGAGDQGTIFGYACNDTPNLMPLAIEVANELAKRLEYVRKENIILGLRPDGKTQVTVEYENSKLKRIENIVISAQHDVETNLEELRKEIVKEVVLKSKYTEYMDEDTYIFVNEKGRFVLGGPLADTGVTGRKLMVDSYGGYAKHGGGAYSGKDFTKVDRSAAYMLRHVAKSVVASRLADKCEIGVSYVIGKENPIAIYLNTFDTNKIEEIKILEIVKNEFDFRPRGIAEYLDLENFKYTKTTNYGHFGKEDMSYEKVKRLPLI